MAFCSGCGEKIEDGSQFCSKCGKPVVNVPVDSTREGKKNTLLLISFIAGLITLIVAVVVLFAPIFPGDYDYDFKSGTIKRAATSSVFALVSDSFQEDPSLKSFGPLALFFMVILSISDIAAVILNYFAWIKNNAKMTLAAAIIYIVLTLCCFLNILSIVLCFIAYGQIGKQGPQG